RRRTVRRPGDDRVAVVVEKRGIRWTASVIRVLRPRQRGAEHAERARQLRRARVCERGVPEATDRNALTLAARGRAPFAAHAGVCCAALRAGRLARRQTMLARHDFPVALLYNTPNIRYATGVDVMSVWTAGTFARYCLVPAQGAPVLFEYSGSMHVSRKLVRDVRPAYTWRFGGAAARDKAREWERSI